MYSQWRNPHLPETPSPSCEQTNISNRLTISTPGLALRSVWEVLPDIHGSDHYPILTSILPSVAEIQPSCDPSHWVFSKANWEQFHDMCMESISEEILEEADPLHSFVERITKAANDCIPKATTIPKKSNPWFDEECREALKARQALIPMAVNIIPYWLRSYHQWQRCNQAVIPPIGFFPRPIGRSFMMCVWKASLRIH